MVSDPPIPAADVSVIVPVYRNPDTLTELHRRISKTLTDRSIRYEILFVDDACPQNSWAVIAQLAARDPRTAGLALARNVGQQRAVQIGLAHATGERMVILDGDLQDPPEAIPALLDRLTGERQAVFAARRGRYESGLRLLTSRLFKTMLHWAAGVPADAGIFCAISRPVARFIVEQNAPRPFIVAMIGWSGAEMISLPVERAPRNSGRSTYTGWKRLAIGTSAVLDSAFRHILRKPAPRADREPDPIRERIGARFQPSGAPPVS